MKDYVYAAGNVLIDLPPSVLVGGILAALVVALATATLYRFLRRKNSEENPTVMTGMILAANVLSMLVAAGYIGHKTSRERSAYWPVPPGPLMRSQPFTPLGDGPMTSRMSPPFERWDAPESERDAPRGAGRNISAQGDRVVAHQSGASTR